MPETQVLNSQTETPAAAAPEAPLREPVATHFDSQVAQTGLPDLEDLVGDDERDSVQTQQPAPDGAPAAGVPEDAPAQPEESVVSDAQEPAPESAVPTALDDYTLLRAQRAGIDAETAAELQAKGRLEPILNAHSANLIDQALQRMQPPAEPPQPEAQAQAQPAQQPSPPPQHQPVPELTFKPEDWRNDDGDTVDPVISRNVERVAQAAGQFQGQVRQVIAQLMTEYVQPMVRDLQTLKAAQQAALVRQFDDLIAQQGEAWQPVFGAGPTTRLGKDSTQAKARQELFRHMVAIDVIRTSEGTARPGDPTYLSEVFQEALGAKHANKLKEIAAAEVQQKVNGRRSQLMHPPTRRTSTELPDERAEAIAAVRKVREAMGLPVNNRMTAAQRAEDEANLLDG